jgi:hypothetical protein
MGITLEPKPKALNYTLKLKYNFIVEIIKLNIEHKSFGTQMSMDFLRK